jgi:putative transposase
LSIIFRVLSFKELSVPVGSELIINFLQELFPKVVEEMPGCEIVKYSLQEDHVHMVMVIPPKYAVSEVVARIKQRTSSELRKKFVWLGRRYWKENVVWSPGYFVSTIGVERERILKYVEHQERQDSGQAKLELCSTTSFARGDLREK